MSIITVQIGQCGNQIGRQFFSTLADDIRCQCIPSQSLNREELATYNSLYSDRFFSTDVDRNGKDKLVARSVLVDTEQKAVAQAVADANKSGVWYYPDAKPLPQKKGSGNNWALGYCGYGQRVEEQIMSCIQRQVEKCDRLGGFLTLMSLAGGTGSGVGAYITECVREEYPHSFNVNQVVWPYAAGEVAVQSYNAVLSLAHIYQSADAIIALENDSLQQICSRLFAIPKVSFQDVNRVIALKLASIFAPVYPSLSHFSNDDYVRNPLGSGNNGAKTRVVVVDTGDMLEHMVPHPEYKMLSLRSIPLISERSVRFSTYQWPGLIKHLRQMLVAGSFMEEGINWQIKPNSPECNRSISNLAILRGLDCSSADLTTFNDSSLGSLGCDWLSSDQSFTAWSHPRTFLQYERSAALLSNDQAAVQCLDSTVERAWNMYAARAYLHQYTAHGLKEDTFMDCFATLEQVLANYTRLNSDR